ncbi:MAG: hypothetical protein WAZ12_04570 [Candidatus Absconditicoccaceae bacterium]
MKKIIFILIGLVSFIGFSFAYQQQGFDNYNELNGSLNFQCSTQCFILIGPVVQNDFININGNLQGNGILGYGFLVGEQIYPGETIQINGGGNIDQKFVLSNAKVYGQMNGDAQLVLLLQGNIIGDQVIINGGIMDIFDNIGLLWNHFRKIEPLTPYSINLRYGIQLFGTSIVKLGYIMFIVFSLWLFLFSGYKKEKKHAKLLYLGLGLFLFIGARNLITYTNITYEGLKNYTFQSIDNKSFFDLGDYIVFTDKIRKNLNLDTNINKQCKIYVDSYQDRPFKSHRDSLYLKPCKVILTGNESDYIIYYKKPIISGDLQKSILVNFNGSYLLQNTLLQNK